MISFAIIASPPIRLHQLLFDIQLNPLAIFSLVLELASIYLYVRGQKRLSTRGRDWSGTKTASFITGVVLIWVATGSGLASYDDSVFEIHVIQHLLLMNFAPIFIALGAPLTMATQASPRSIQVKIVAFLHSKPMLLLTFPAFTWIANLATMYLYFLTPIYQLSLDHPLFHDYTHLQFLVVGLLFWTTAIGVDPSPWRPGIITRLGFILSGIPFSAFLGIAIMGMRKSISPAHTLADTHAGGALLWGLGEFTNVIGLLVLVFQWSKLDARQAKRIDRELDKQLIEEAKKNENLNRPDS